MEGNLFILKSVYRSTVQLYIMKFYSIQKIFQVSCISNFFLNITARVLEEYEENAWFLQLSEKGQKSLFNWNMYLFAQE